MPKLGEITLKEAAKNAAGNWRNFHCFVWWREPGMSDADQWTIIYTHHRDSGLIDQSNAAVIVKALEPFAEGSSPDVVFEQHSHWAVGHIDGFSIRVFRKGRITQAFRQYHDLAQQMDQYPILDESDYSNREYEATVENIEDAAWRLKNEFALPEGWAAEVYDWLSHHEWTEIENVDDNGGYPDQDALKRGFEALGFAAVT